MQFLNGNLSRKDRYQVSKIASSSKFVGSTVFRPDIAGKDRVTFEIRDCHSNIACIVERLERFVLQQTTLLSRHQIFAELPSFDSVNTYQQLSPLVRSSLEKVLPNDQRQVIENARANGKALPWKEDWYENELLAVDLYRNFAWPLREWKPWLRALGSENLQVTVAQAQQNYSSRLQRAAENLRQKTISEQQFLLEAQQALATFSYESQLSNAFQKWAQNLEKDNLQLRQVQISSEIGQRNQTLYRKLNALMQKWQSHVRWASNVSFAEGNDSGAHSRDLLIIDYKLNERQKQDLTNDLNNVFNETISSHNTPRSNIFTLEWERMFMISNFRVCACEPTKFLIVKP